MTAAGIRLSIFIDGAYLFKGFALYGLAGYRYSPGRLERRLSENHYLVKVHYYNSINNRDPLIREKQEKFYYGVLRDKLHWDVNILSLQWPGGVAQQKGVDTTLALQMHQHALNDEYETAIILAADADFVPLVELVKPLGKVVRNAYFSLRPSWFLQQSCNGQPIRLDDLDFVYEQANYKILRSIEQIRRGAED